jgi:hypothetical protein
MSALQRLIDLGDAKKYDEMSTAEFVLYTDWIVSKREGKDVSEFLDEAAAEIAAYRDLLDGIRETRHMGSFAVAAHVKAVLELCEEQLAAALDRKPSA